MQRIFQRHRDLSHQNNWQPRHNQCTADCCSYCISGWWSGTKEYIILHNISYTRVLPLHYAEADFVWRRWRQMCLCACLVFNPVRDDDRNLLQPKSNTRTHLYIYYNITTHNFIYCKSILPFFRRVFMLRWWNQPRLRAHGLEPGRAAVGGDGEEPQNRGAGDHQRHAQCASGAVTNFFLGSCFDSKRGCLNYKTHRIHVCYIW